MNISHRYKLIWWASGRCASRFTSRILSPLQFYNYDEPIITKLGPYFDLLHEDDSSDLPMGAFSHKLIVPANIDLSGYKIIANIRNPYDIFYSNYRLESIEHLRGILKKNPTESDIQVSFEDWAKIEMEFYYNNIEQIKNAWDIYNLQKKSDVDYLIRYEYLNDDILNVPLISELYNSNEVYNKVVNSLLEDPTEYRRGLPHINQTFKDVFNEEMANYVYERYKYQFDEFGYDKDSWKK